MLTSIKRLGGAYLGFVPVSVLYGLFFCFPLALIVCYSFWKVVEYQLVHDWSFANYDYLIGVPTYRTTLVTTLTMAALVTLLDVVLAFPVAYWLSRRVSRSWQGPLLVLFLFPFLASYLLRVYSWITILDANGVVNQALEATGVVSEPLDWILYNRQAVVVVLVYLYFPFAVVTLYASLQRFDFEQLSAAMDLGASRATAMRRVMLPQVRPGIATASIFVFVPVLGEYLVPQVVGGPDGVMFGNVLANFFQGGEYTRGAAAALLLVGVIVALLIAVRGSLEVRGVDVARR